MPDQERLDLALRRAAELSQNQHYNTASYREALAGWAEAIRHLTTVEDAVGDDDYIPHLGDCYVGKCDLCRAIAKFITAMLGGDDA